MRGIAVRRNSANMRLFCLSDRGFGLCDLLTYFLYGRVTALIFNQQLGKL